MKSPEMSMGTSKELPKTEVPTEISVEATPLTQEIKDAMQKEYESLQDERSKLQEAVEKDFASILEIEPIDIDIDLKKADFKGVEAVRAVMEQHQGDLPALQKALRELAVPLFLRMGTLGKVKRFAENPGVNMLVAIDNQLKELRKKLYG